MCSGLKWLRGSPSCRSRRCLPLRTTFSLPLSTALRDRRSWSPGSSPTSGYTMPWLELVGLDHLRVVRLAHADGHVVQQLHRVRCPMSMSWKFCGSSGPTGRKRSMDHLFIATQYLPSGADGVAFGSARGGRCCTAPASSRRAVHGVGSSYSGRPASSGPRRYPGTALV